MHVMTADLLGDFLLPIIAILSVFGTLFGLVWIFIRTRNSERLAMIERGIDPAAFLPKPESKRMLRIALFFVGIGLGLLFGDLMAKYTVVDVVTSYFSMILVFSGLGIMLGFKLSSGNN